MSSGGDTIISVQAEAHETNTVEELYSRAYVIDAMCFSASPPYNYVTSLTRDKVEALRRSGFTALSLCMTVPEQYDLSAVQKTIADWDRFLHQHSDLFLKVTNAGHLDKAKQTGKIGMIYNLQNTAACARSLDKLQTLLDLGVRQVQLTHDYRNFAADACRELTNAGLSQFGFQVVELLNEEGILVDLTHVGERSALDAILHSRAPVIFSHSGCYALCPHPRNVSDRNIRAMAERGGVFCIYNQSGWLTKDPTPSIEHFVAHLQHVIDVAGEEHVGVGTDGDVVDMSAMRPGEVDRHQALFEQDRAYFPQLTWPVKHMRIPELSHPRRMLHLADSLQKKGYSARVIEKVLGGNYARVFREVVMDS